MLNSPPGAYESIAFSQIIISFLSVKEHWGFCSAGENNMIHPLWMQQADSSALDELQFNQEMSTPGRTKALGNFYTLREEKVILKATS